MVSFLLSWIVTVGRRWVACDAPCASACLLSTSEQPFFQSHAKWQVTIHPQLHRADLDLHGQNAPVELPLVPLPAQRPLLRYSILFVVVHLLQCSSTSPNIERGLAIMIHNSSFASTSTDATTNCFTISIVYCMMYLNKYVPYLASCFD
mmetsp:Transcript_9809/g.23983  ORF Transcript_9809/g.23983 Transcript_9809/m.23983 type:complete len:149 (-) Transcript_9809:107-553(-)